MAEKNKLKVWGGLFFAALLIGVYLVFVYYARIFSPNVNLKGKKSISIYVKTGTDLHEFKQVMIRSGILVDTESFWWVAQQKEFKKVLPGHYVVMRGMSNNEMVNMFRAGLQTPVNMRIPVVRTKAQLASRLAKQIEADSAEIAALLSDASFLAQHGFTKETAISVFLPDTYEVYWNQSAESLFLKMKRYYTKFWTDERIKKAKKLNFTKHDVATLASIVQSEQMRFPDERPKIAGLYINRLRKRIRLESDPTLIFALGNFNIRRVLNKDKKVNSPYNTYMHYGLPPGPIMIPTASSLNAVLDYEQHRYLFMCAKDDFSGRHNFARSYAQHLRNARKYHRALNKRRIKR